MSHLTQAQLQLELIKSEESFKNALNRFEEYNLSEQARENLMIEFKIFEIQNMLSGYKNKALSEVDFKIIREVGTKIHNFFNGIESYIALNFDLKVTDYNNSIRNIAANWAELNKGILAEALQETTDDLFRNYLIATYKKGNIVTKEQLIEDAKQMMQNSLQYKQQQAQENVRKIIKLKQLGHANETKVEVGILEQIAAINSKLAQTSIDKAVRNRVLTAIIKIIKAQGFIVNRENVTENGDSAIINSIKPNGETARFEVHLDGRFVYKYHEYVGLSCENDIEKFEQEFENIYGIKLEDKKLLWSNPDRIYKQANQTFKNKRIGDS